MSKKIKSSQKSIKSYNLLIAAIILILLVFALILNVAVLQKNNKELNQKLSLIEQHNNKTEGLTCGIISKKFAETELESAVKKEYSNSVKAISIDSELTIWDFNSCTYTSIVDSNKYIDFNISTYENAVIARERFPMLLPKVGAKKINKITENFDQVYYGSGAFYILYNNQIIQISGGTGTPSEAERFSKELYGRIVLYFE